MRVIFRSSVINRRLLLATLGVLSAPPGALLTTPSRAQAPARPLASWNDRPAIDPRLRTATVAFFVTAAHGLGTPPAHAGPCSNEIAQFEQSVRQSAGNPNAGPVAPQSIDAQLNRQPTPDSIKRAQAQAQAAFEAILARAKSLDAQDDRAGCAKALADAKAMYNLQ